MEFNLKTLAGLISGKTVNVEQVARGAGQAEFGAAALATGVAAVGPLAELACPLAGLILLAPVFSLGGIAAKVRLEGLGADGPAMLSEEFDLVNPGLIRPTTPLAPASWMASTSYAQGDIIVPTSANGRFYFCFQAGTSDTTEPTWTEALGDIEDGGAWWRDMGPMVPVAAPSTWTAETTYAPGTLVIPTTPNGHVYAHAWPTEAASDDDEPTWPEDGSFVADNSLLWQDLGPAVYPGEYLALENLFGALSVRIVVTEAPESGSFDLWAAVL